MRAPLDTWRAHVRIEPMIKACAGLEAGRPAVHRVAPTKRAAEAELSALHAIADRERYILALRQMLDPDERLSSKAEWEARAASRYDTAKAVASAANAERFGAVTLRLIRDVGALPDWSGSAPPLVREATTAAGLLPALNAAFERSAQLARDSMTVGLTPRGATLAPRYR